MTSFRPLIAQLPIAATALPSLVAGGVGMGGSDDTGIVASR